MNLILFHDNPRLLILTLGLIFITGVTSYRALPRLEDPTIGQRVAAIKTFWPGASAERVETLVTERLETELEEFEEIKTLQSASRVGYSLITIELADRITDVEPVWSRIRDRISDAVPGLPPGVSKPKYERIEPVALAYIVALEWVAKTPVQMGVLGRLAKDLEEDLRDVPGSRESELFGEPTEEILVTVKPAVLSALAIDIDVVARQILASDAKVAAGTLRTARSRINLEVEGALDSLERIRRIPVHLGSESQASLLGDIATVERSVRTPPASRAIIDGRESVVVGLRALPSTRVDRWTSRVREVISRCESRLPRSVRLRVLFEQDRYVQERLSTLILNLVMGGSLVIAVLIFLMGWRASLIIGTALPMTALLVVAGLDFLKIPLHQMSVTGLIIALGLLIDNAIVIVDEVSHRLENGMDEREAMAGSVRHLGIPLLSSTLTTIFAFMPIALMAGPAGEFTSPIAMSVILAVSGSLFISLAILPSLTARVLHGQGYRGKARTCSATGFASERLTRGYRQSLSFAFRYPLLGICLGLALPAVGFVVVSDLPEQFFPAGDRDQFQIEIELPTQASLERTHALTRKADVIIRELNGVRNVYWFIGKSAPMFYYNMIGKREGSSGFASAVVQLEEADLNFGLARKMQNTLSDAFPEARCVVRPFEQGPPFEAPIEIRLYGNDQNKLQDLGESLRLELTRIPEVIHTRASLGEYSPQIRFDLDEILTRFVGLNPRDVARQIESVTEGKMGGSIVEASEELPVRVRVPDNRRDRLSWIGSVDVVPLVQAQAAHPVRIPLATIGRVNLIPELSSIFHHNGRRSNRVQAFLRPGILPGAVLKKFKDRLQDQGFQIPPG